MFTDRIDPVVIDVAEEKAQIDNQSTNYQDILRIITQLSRYFCLVQDGDLERSYAHPLRVVGSIGLGKKLITNRARQLI